MMASWGGHLFGPMVYIFSLTYMELVYRPQGWFTIPVPKHCVNFQISMLMNADIQTAVSVYALTGK